MIILNPILPSGRRRLIDTGLCRETFDWFVIGQPASKGDELVVSKLTHMYDVMMGLVYRVDHTRYEKEGPKVRLRIIDTTDSPHITEEYDRALSQGLQGIVMRVGDCSCNRADRPMLTQKLPTLPISTKVVVVIDEECINVTDKYPMIEYCYRNSIELKDMGFYSFNELDEMVESGARLDKLSISLYKRLLSASSNDEVIS